MLRNELKNELVSRARRFFDGPAPAHLARRHRPLSGVARADLETTVREFLLECRQVPPDQLDRTVHRIVEARVAQHRRKTVPWLSDCVELDGLEVLEVGSGAGASTYALAEQGARVTATDLDEPALQICARRFELGGLPIHIEALNAADLASRFAPQSFDAVLFYASLEHMTLDERLQAIRGAFQVVRPGGVVMVAETPNRLWYFDAHTSQLPFFMWLPDELAYRYARLSPRDGFRDVYDGAAEPQPMLHFLRRGRGVSFHDFELALDQRADQFEVVGSMQVWRRQHHRAREFAWSVSRAGRFERSLRAAAPHVHRGFFQPFLYIALRRSSA